MVIKEVKNNSKKSPSMEESRRSIPPFKKALMLSGIKCPLDRFCTLGPKGPNSFEESQVCV
jgi:hypothetical protein